MELSVASNSLMFHLEAEMSEPLPGLVIVFLIVPCPKLDAPCSHCQRLTIAGTPAQRSPRYSFSRMAWDSRTREGVGHFRSAVSEFGALIAVQEVELDTVYFD